ncbi:MAG: SufD family Fe-S cluster assembly protein [Brucellaceae bacterium]|nr:SufD family Fe-S cluster assembly protein [Brucellaceae bacterium]
MANHVNAVTSLEVGEGADVTWLIVQEHGNAATHLGQFNARLAADAKLTLFILNAGTRFARQEVNVRAEGEGGNFQMRCVNLLAGDCHNDVTMVLDHIAPATDSVEIVRNVVMDRAQGVFQGQIRVAREAQKTDARMACNSLLLSDDAGYSAKPELEIFADDVACGHGATVAEIDHDHLFYLMSRGVPEREARGLLDQGLRRRDVAGRAAHHAGAKLESWFAAHRGFHRRHPSGDGHLSPQGGDYCG